MATLTWPLRLAPDGSLATAEQGTDADLESCVSCALSYPAGWRLDDPAFGRPELTFKQGGVDIAGLATAITDSEPRATPELVARALEQGVQTVAVDTRGQLAS
jgi:hypothetical protein